MNCPDDAVLDDFVDGDLTDAERVAVEKHISTCPACRERVEAAKRADAAARDALSALRRSAPPLRLAPITRRQRSLAVPLWGAAAAVLIAALASGYTGFVAGSTRTPEVIRAITVVANSTDGFWSLRQKAPAAAAERKSPPRNCEFWDYRAALEKARRGERG